MTERRDREKDAQLADELRQRGHSDDEIAAMLRKKRNRRTIDYDLVSARARDLSAERAAARKAARRRARPGAASGDILTVEDVASQFQLHPKTVQRFIREGRLQAERVGRSYRILRADAAAFAGLPLAQPIAPPPISVTAIVDIPAVDADALRYWKRQFSGRISGRRIDEGDRHVELIHDAAQAHLKLILVGSPAQTGDLLGLIALWRRQRD